MKARLAYDQTSKDKDHAAASDDRATASFDFYKVLSCPYLHIGLVYDKKLLVFYNLYAFMRPPMKVTIMDIVIFKTRLHLVVESNK